MAMTNLVHLPALHDAMPAYQSFPSIVAPLTRLRTCLSPQSANTPSQNMVSSCFWGLKIARSESVKHILLNSSCNTTKCTYTHKWNRFQHCCVPGQLVLDYLLQLKQDGLAGSSVSVYLAAITTFHYPIDGLHAASRYVFSKGHSKLIPTHTNPYPNLASPPSPTLFG